MGNYDADYFYQHKLIPSTFFEDRGKFISALANNGGKVLYSGACAVYEHQGIKEMPYTPDQFDAKVYKYDDNTFFAELTFPEPEEPALCSQMFLIFDEPFEKLMHFCVEKGEEGDDFVFLCGWDPNGRHLNFGPCQTAEDEALKKALSIYLQAIEE